MTVKEAAAALEVSIDTIYQLCAANRIEHARHGTGRGTIRITPAAIGAYLASVSRGGPDQRRPVVQRLVIPDLIGQMRAEKAARAARSKRRHGDARSDV